MPFAQHTRCICSWWHWLLFVKSAISSFCVQLQDHELQQSKVEVCEAHLAIKRLSQKQIKQSLKQFVSSTFENTWEHQQGFVQLKRFCTAFGASAESAPQVRSFVTTGSSAVTSSQATNLSLFADFT